MPKKDEARISIACPDGDADCQKRFKTSVMEGGENNYPVTLLSLTSDTQAVAEGFRVNVRIVIANKENHDFGPFRMAISPAAVRQGDPLLPPALLIVEVPSLAAGATGVYSVDRLLVDGPKGGKFHCLKGKAEPPR